MKTEELKELQTIPGVGPSIAEDLWNLRIYSLHDLKDKIQKFFMKIYASNMANILIVVFYMSLD